MYHVELRDNAYPNSEMCDKWENMSQGPDVGRWIKAMVREGFLEQVADEQVLVYTKHKAIPKPGTQKKRIVGIFNSLNDITLSNLGLSKDPLTLCRQAAN